MPMMPFIGVRISWLTVARKRDLATLAIFRPLARADQRCLGPFARGDIARDSAMRNRLTRKIAHGKLDPRKPAGAGLRVDRDVGRAEALPVGKGGVGNHTDFDAKVGKRSPVSSPWVADKRREYLVGIDDPPVSVAMDDEITERIDQTEEMLVAFVEFPHAVGEMLRRSRPAATCRVASISGFRLLSTKSR